MILRHMISFYIPGCAILFLAIDDLDAFLITIMHTFRPQDALESDIIIFSPYVERLHTAS